MDLQTEEATFAPLGDRTSDSARRAVLLAVDDEAGRALLQLRDADRPISYPGWWGMFGGEVEPGQTLVAAARRELHEEIGLDLPPDAFLALGRIASGWPGGGCLFALRVVPPVQPPAIALAEGASFAFFSLAQTAGLWIVPECRAVLAAAAVSLAPRWPAPFRDSAPSLRAATKAKAEMGPAPRIVLRRAALPSTRNCPRSTARGGCHRSLQLGQRTDATVPAVTRSRR